jgi:hypothetical protein
MPQPSLAGSSRFASLVLESPEPLPRRPNAVTAPVMTRFFHSQRIHSEGPPSRTRRVGRSRTLSSQRSISGVKSETIRFARNGAIPGQRFFGLE